MRDSTKHQSIAKWAQWDLAQKLLAIINLSNDPKECLKDLQYALQNVKPGDRIGEIEDSNKK